MSPGTRSGPVDWPDVRRRIEELRRVVESDARPAPEDVRRILGARARELARPIASEEAASEREILTLTLDGELYALDTRGIVAVGRTGDLVPLVGAPPPLLGLTAWRGNVLLLVDLPSLLGRQSSSPVERRHQIVLGGGDTTFGVLVDAVGEIRSIRPREIAPVPETLAATAELAVGVVSAAVLVLDHDALVRCVAQLR